MESKEIDPKFQKRIVTVVSHPSKAMQWAVKSPVIGQWMLFLFVMALVIFIPQRSLFIQKAMAVLMNTSELSSEKMLDLAKESANAAVMLNVVYFVGTPLVKGCMVYMLSIVAGAKCKFKSSLSVVLQAYMIMTIGQLLRMPVAILMSNAEFSYSPTLFFAVEDIGQKSFALLSAFDIFALLYLIVTGIGIHYLTGLSKVKAMLLSFAPWMLILFFGTMSLNNL